MNDDSTNNMDVEMEDGEENDDIYEYGDTSDGSGGNHSDPYQYGIMINNNSNLHEQHHHSRPTSSTTSGAQPPLSTIMYGQQQQQQHQRTSHHQTGGIYQNGGYTRRFSSGAVPFGPSSNGGGTLSSPSIGDTLDAASAAIAAVDMLSFHNTNSNSNNSSNLHHHGGSQHSSQSYVHPYHLQGEDSGGGGGEDEADLGYEPCMPQTRRGSMTADEERQRRASIKAVMADTTLSPLSKRRSIQYLMDGRRKSMSSMIPTVGGSSTSSGMHSVGSGVGLPPTGRRNSMSGYISSDGGVHGGIPPGGRRFSMNSGITSSNYPGMSYLPYTNSNHHHHQHHPGSSHSVGSSEISCGNGDASVGDTSTSATDLQCSNDSSYLDHYGYNQHHNSNSTNTDIHSSSPMNNDTSNSPFSFNNNNDSNTNDSNNPKKNYFLQRQSEKLFAISNEQTRFTEQMRPPCSHYVRNCTIIAACCGAAFGCRLCHDESPNLPPKINNGGEKYHRSASLPSSFVSMEQEDTHHTIDRFAIAEIICRQCYTRQSSKTNNCVRCNIQFGDYHCKVCNLWMSNEERPYHCEHCGFCRVGGAENFRHCHRCGMCIDISLIETHNCKAGKYRSNCPVCQEYLFSSRGASHEMPCGHAIHWECFRQLAVHDSRCPICKKTAETRERMIPTWTAMAASIAMQPLPPELARVVSITCNDCESAEDARAWHFLGMQCNKCQSFNTVVDRIHLTGEEAHEFLETNARIAAAYQQRLQANNSGDDNNEEQPEQPRRRVNRRRSAF